jgi:hypothetical protein
VRRFIVAMLLNVVSCAQAATLSVEALDVGERYQFSRVETQIQITNPGTKTVPIGSIKAFHPGDRVLHAPVEVAAGATATATVELSIENDLGNRWHVFDVRIDKDEPLAHLARAHVFGLSLLDEPRLQLDFGVANAGDEVVPQLVKISSRETPGLKATKVLSVPDAFVASLSDDGLSVIVSVNKAAPWGLHDTYVKVALGSAQQSEAWIEVRADVHGTVVPASNPYALGVVRAGSKNEFLIRLENRAGKDFQIDKVVLEGIKGKVEANSCIPRKADCRMIHLTVADGQETGKITGRILVGLPEFKRTLPIVVGGMFLKADTQIVSLDEQLKKSADGQSSVAVRPDNIAEALKKALHPPAQVAAPSGTGPLLKWSVANELSVYGYLIYRAESEQGPFQRVNKEVVRVVSDDDTGGTYQWRDDTASSGQTYWYSIGLVYSDGQKKQLTSPQKVVAK